MGTKRKFIHWYQTKIDDGFSKLVNPVDFNVPNDYLRGNEKTDAYCYADIRRKAKYPSAMFEGTAEAPKSVIIVDDEFSGSSGDIFHIASLEPNKMVKSVVTLALLFWVVSTAAVRALILVTFEGSHKPNSAIAQAYYNKVFGIKRLSTETGAGQWGSALSMACAMFGLECRVFMVKISYEQKPYRRLMMAAWGAECL